ncbi:response regulator [Bacillus sp. FJAT-42376]|uniref:response regulator n=1 Tax=Bacillus sp. FJAT-42376 TaxID=2014076 RepID=UPI0013DDAB15|nr:response regulator [Bacillus sp. FJAT-42376]
MYTLFIADDEKIVIEGLTSAVDWEKYKIQITGTAMDGIDALKQINCLRPDIVLADIRMPGMNGLDLIREAKRENPNLLFIMISGYSEFTYAKRAIEMEAVDYLVKPMEAADIVASVKKAIEKLEKRKEESKLTSKIELYEAELEEKHVLDVLMGRCPLKPVPIRPLHEYAVAVIRGHNEAFVVHLREKCLEEFIYIVEDSVVMVSPRPHDLQDMLISLADLGNPVMGISRVRQNDLHLPAAYEEAKEALKIGIFGSQCLTKYEELKEYGLHQGTTMLKEIELFFSSRPADVWNEMGHLIDKTMNYAEVNKLSPKKTKYLCFNLIKTFLRHVEAEYELEDKLFGEGYLLYEEMEELKSREELKQWLTNTVREAVEYLDQNRISFNEKLVLELKQYVNEHYSEPIVLDELGRRFYKSPAYLCSLFSKNAGQTIFEYITSVRIEHAKRLLRSTNLKISEICEKTGYSNHKYFNQVFKKHAGKTPGQYRSRHLVKQE